MARRLAMAFVMLSLVLITPLAALAQDNPDGVPGKAEAATVVAVPNGGTIVVALADGSQRNVGLIGVSAPAAPTATEPGQCHGEESRLYLEGMAIPGSVVYLEQDPDVRERDETLLRFVWAVPANGSKAFLVNTKMVRDGYADVGQSGDKSKHADRLEAAEDDAKDADKGAWGACGQMHKENPLTEEQRLAQYQQVDIRDVDIRPGNYFGQKIVFSGSVLTIAVAPPGKALFVGDNVSEPFETVLQVTVGASDGSSVTVVVGYSGDSSGIFEGTWVTVYGSVIDVFTFTNMLGGGVTQTLIAADQVQM